MFLCRCRTIFRGLCGLTSAHKLPDFCFLQPCSGRWYRRRGHFRSSTHHCVSLCHSGRYPTEQRSYSRFFRGEFCSISTEKDKRKAYYFLWCRFGSSTSGNGRHSCGRRIECDLPRLVDFSSTGCNLRSFGPFEGFMVSPLLSFRLTPFLQVWRSAKKGVQLHKKEAAARKASKSNSSVVLEVATPDAPTEMSAELRKIKDSEGLFPLLKFLALFGILAVLTIHSIVVGTPTKPSLVGIQVCSPACVFFLLWGPPRTLIYC